MNNFIKKIALIALFIFTILSCSKDDAPANNGTTPTGNCLSGSMAYTQTNVGIYPASNAIIVSFDVKNNSTTNYSITAAGVGNFIYYKIKVKTTDGTIYEKTGPFLTDISAGATKSVEALGDYGAGKTYESYTISLYCQ
jgi:hypothetical protein